MPRLLQYRYEARHCPTLYITISDTPASLQASWTLRLFGRPCSCRLG